MKSSGRLELTWANKNLRLLAHDDQSFTWVERDDWRITEIRLLRELEVVGEPSDNLLIRGDALDALTSLVRLPDFRRRYAGKVMACYVDSPFNTGQAFAQYDDALENSAWLTFMRDRLEQIRDLLAPDGSIWLHLDDAQQHRARIVLDEVFGSDWFVGTVIWRKADTLRNDARRFSVSHDYIHVYAAPGWEANRLPRTAAMDAIYRNPDDDPRGPWLAGTLISPHFRTSGDFEVVTPGGAAHRAPAGTSWRVPRDTFERLKADNRIWFGRDGRGTPQQKLFLGEAKDRVVDTIWDVKDVGGNRQSKAEVKRLLPSIVPFETPKPERLIERILHVATQPGDLVLDCFAGSGTTAAVAQKMRRSWVTIELLEATVDTYVRPRLEMVVRGEDPGGITASAGWTGGGGFRHLEVAPSMFEEIEGTVVLAEWASGGDLAAAVAAQFGYTFAPAAPFAGHRGRSRLAVIDGVLTEGVVRYLVERLTPGDGLLIVAEAIETGAGELAGSLVKGAKIRKVPRDLARVGRQLTLPTGPHAAGSGASS